MGLTQGLLASQVGRAHLTESMRRVSREPAEWREGTAVRTATLHLTAAELHAIDDEIAAVLERYRDRSDDPSLRPAGSRPVRLFVSAHLPLPAPPEE